MAATAKKIVISGYYGFNNSGDEAVLQSILLALAEQGARAGLDIEPIVLSVNPDLTSRMYGVRSVHRMKLQQVAAAIRESDGLISGGGSLLQDATGKLTIPYYLGIIKLAQLFGKPTFIYSQGIGPVHSRLFYPAIQHVFRRSSYVSVRDTESAELLAKMGLGLERMEVVPDPVMGLPRRAPAGAGGLQQKPATSEPVVGISVRFWNENRSELRALAVALQQLNEKKPVRLRFLPFHQPSDAEASRVVIEHLPADLKSKSEVADGLDHPQDMLSAVSECDLLIGMRLHSLIYAASQQVPLVGISYDPKIDQFLNRLAMRAAASTESFDSVRVAEEAARLLNDRERWIQDKASVIGKLQQQAQQPAQHIAAFFRREG
ncbi:polysaccharide pyruvyl transferase CsaB [Paenibacillus sp. y28]|uniref:polysaccharide pyruvyl transferase CsaB n=1 Tax=Paenibacillus sp. y28 TaxID=3129110 RepID=UPI00301AD3B6